ncbi:hypothetical protein HY358_00940 [Candidatus Roizmanbacteria bacterium]|nr:hypothetical protein [Candidatus Roizmanbacteria bacterium]
MQYKIIRARFSDMCLLVPKFIVVDVYIIGTHEKANNLHKDQMLDVVRSLIAFGYRGPALSVFEKGKDDIYESVEQNTFEKYEPKYGQIGIADGHNRLESLKLLDCLGLLRDKFIPVQIIPGRKPELVTIKTSNKADIPWTIEEIESCFTDENKAFELTNTSHFEAAFSDNVWRRVRESQPDIVISKEEFINIDKLRELTRNLELGKVVDIDPCLEKFSIGADFLRKMVQ